MNTFGDLYNLNNHKVKIFDKEGIKALSNDQSKIMAIEEKDFSEIWIDEIEAKSEEIANKIISKFLSVKNLKDKVDWNDFEYVSRDIENIKRIGVIDGGNNTIESVGIVIYMVRATGIIFEEGKKPKYFRNLTIDTLIPFTKVRDRVRLIRDTHEIELARTLVEEKVDILIIDGSLFGLAARPPPGTQIEYKKKPDRSWFQDYIRFMNSLYNLLDTAEQAESYSSSEPPIILGLSKDSRAQHFLNRLNLMSDYQELTDSSFFWLVSEGKPGFVNPQVFDLTKFRMWLPEEVEHLWEKYQVMYSSYAILRNRAQPLRVDFPTWNKGREEELFSFLLEYADDDGYIFPMHFPHRESKVQDILMEKTYNAISAKILSRDEEVFQACFRKSRRERIG